MEIKELVEKVRSEWEEIFIQEEENIRNIFLSNFFYKMNKNLVLIISMIIIFFCILISKGSSQKFIYFNF